MGKLFLIIGLIGLCHAGYSATQHRSYMRLTEHDEDANTSRLTSLPLDILIQTLVCLGLSCFGVINIATKFRPIKITSEYENKTWDNVANRTSFYRFNHRGKYLFSPDLNQADLDPILNEYVNIKPVSRKPPPTSQREQIQEVETSGSESDSDSNNSDYEPNSASQN